MPAVRNRGRAPSEPSRVKIAPVIAKNTPQARPKKEKPTCAICLDDLDRKRVTRVSCGHRFHWTARQNRSVRCAVLPWGVSLVVKTKNKSWSFMVDRNRIDLDRTRKQLESAKEMMKGADFVTDIEEEISKLEQRKNILKEMKQMRQIWQRPIPKPARRVEWDYEYENRRAYGKVGDELRPHPSSIFSRSDTEASAHSSDYESDGIIPFGYWEEELRYLPDSTPAASVQIIVVSATRGVARPSPGASARPAAGRSTSARAASRASTTAPAPRTQVRRSASARNRSQAAARAATLTSDDESDTEEQTVRAPRTRLTAAKEEEERAGVARRLRSRQH
ncbi:hypothetical protein PRIPAC_92185 [Pristionchus pacificus]|uniref:Uncharacterized protein n=1 Tax=Pristionchus pacificus TaxID=54126 RepID=A0A2A6B9U7_PRIPA|nr:hypothetical protein PRIPAC_92185 [Pristionchus pacificus]|eukprot:PDM62655.1 hypothetical protein PRIPAC_49870 [Pristionchus pacificus]